MSVGLDEQVWKRLLRRLKKLDNMHVKVGLLQSKGGGEQVGDGLTIVDIGVVHEFGAPDAGIPERSWLRRTFKKQKRAMAKLTESLARAVVLGEASPDNALSLLGAWGAAQVKKTITFGAPIPPKLKPATVAAKGSSRPLVDTGRMVQAISWEVSR